MPYIKLAIVAVFVLSAAYVHFRGRARLRFWRQVTDHSTFMAPVNCLMYLSSRVSSKPFLPVRDFPELRPLLEHWMQVRDEAVHLYERGSIKASDRYDDVGFNSFFKAGWKRFYLKWYDSAHPSARTLCPLTTHLLSGIPQVKAAMEATKPGQDANRDRATSDQEAVEVVGGGAYSDEEDIGT